MVWNFIKKITGSDDIWGVGEEAAKLLLRNVPVINGVFNYAIDKVEDMKLDQKLQDLTKAKENITFGLTKSKEVINKIQREKEALEKEFKEANKEQKEELSLQKKALEQFEQALHVNHQELIYKQNDLARAMSIMQNNSLAQEVKLGRLEELANDERIRLNAFERKIDSFEENIAGLQNDFELLEKKLIEEKKEREKLQKDLDQTNKNLEGLSQKIKQNGLTTDKLLQYKKLKQERKKILEKLKILESEKDIQSTKEIFDKWIDEEKKYNRDNVHLLKGMPLDKNSSWAKKYSPEQLNELGWEVIDKDNAQFKWLELKINELINHNLKDLDSVFSSLEREELIRELAKNEELLLEICQELDLKFPIKKEKIEENKPENKIPEQHINKEENNSYLEKTKILFETIKEKAIANKLISFLYFIIFFLLIIIISLFKRKANKLKGNANKKEERDNRFSLFSFLIFIISCFSIVSIFFLYKKQSFYFVNKEEMIKDLKNDLEIDLTKKIDLELSGRNEEIKEKIQEEIKKKEFDSNDKISFFLTKDKLIDREFQRIIRDIKNIDPNSIKTVNNYLNKIDDKVR